MSKVLVVYYSYSNGNTEKIALKLAHALNGDICAIIPQEAYSEDYEETVAIGKKEVDNHMLRSIQKMAKDINDYDVIAIGTPTWWYTMAPCVKTFLTENDFSNKKVIPFMTNAGWPGTVIKDMKDCLKGAEIIFPKEILFDSNGGSKMITSSEEINQWINSMQFER